MVAFQNRPCVPSRRRQVWIPRRTISWWKASLPPQKESWAFFWTFSFHFLSFNGVFLNLKCRTLVLKHLHGDRAAAICRKWISVTKVSKYGKCEYSRALNASYTFQPLMSFWLHLSCSSCNFTEKKSGFSRCYPMLTIFHWRNSPRSLCESQLRTVFFAFLKRRISYKLLMAPRMRSTTHKN